MRQLEAPLPPAAQAAPKGANIIATDIQAGNGVIHFIDRIVLPT